MMAATMDRPGADDRPEPRFGRWAPPGCPLRPSLAVPYRDPAGRVTGWVLRWDAVEGKKILPLFWDGVEWRLGAMPEPRPLLNLPTILRDSERPILIVEGERAAVAAAKRFPEYIATTSVGGAMAAAKSDWSALRGRRVTIWQDNDAAGGRYGEDAARLSLAAGAAEARIVDLAALGPLPAGWDLADDLPAHLDAAAIRAAVESAPRWRPATVAAATGDGAAEGPRPLLPPPGEPLAYPVHLLPLELREPIEALHRVTQAPLALCGQSVIAAGAYAVQPLADVLLPFGRAAPLSILALTVAESSERKSTADGLATRAIREREDELRRDHAAETATHRDAVAVWTRMRSEAEGTKGKGRTERLADLDAAGPEPERPLDPTLIVGDATGEGIAKLFADGRPSLMLLSAEGAVFVEGHAMSREAKGRTAAALSLLWDGAGVRRARATDGRSSLPGVRLTGHLLMQPDVAARFLSDRALRDQGILSRALIAAPATTAGTRLYRPPSAADLATLDAWTGRLGGLLRHDWPLAEGSRQELRPPALPMSPEATAAWVGFHDHVERQVAPGEPLAAIRGWAGKAAEHAARLAGVVSLVADPLAVEIGADAMRAGIGLAEFHLGEALRLIGCAGASPEMRDAETLRQWLIEAWSGEAITPTLALQHGPSAVRTDADQMRALFLTLEAHGWLVPIPGGAEVSGRRRREAWRIVRGGGEA